MQRALAPRENIMVDGDDLFDAAPQQIGETIVESYGDGLNYLTPAAGPQK